MAIYAAKSWGRNRETHDDELDRMRSLARKAMEEGAWGMSTGLIYVPGTYAKTAELVAIAKVVAEFHGIYASHIRNEGSGLMDAIGEAIQIGKEAQLPFISLTSKRRAKPIGEVCMSLLA